MGLYLAGKHCISLSRRSSFPFDQSQAGDRLAGAMDRGADGPVQTPLRSEAVRLVAAAIRRLPEEARSEFVLRYYHQMGFKDIAQVLGCSEGAARTRATRARQSIAAALGSYLIEP
ncbi:MAG: sigma factor-like helix-turn-helix DNA-binding protein [Sedimentisphaerales bacterium]|nr:sigma factor-like helix-turn-helix DNA-binding protein [Sedimentisphaerales bacterium]